jgi:hypothetical protein
MKNLQAVFIGLAMMSNLYAARTEFNFQEVELFSFSCVGTSVQKSITGAEWNRDEAILRVFKGEQELEYIVTKKFVGKSLIFIGEPIDGSEGNMQFIVRKAKKSTVVLNSRGATKLNCQLELL